MGTEDVFCPSANLGHYLAGEKKMKAEERKRHFAGKLTSCILLLLLTGGVLLVSCNPDPNSDAVATQGEARTYYLPFFAGNGPDTQSSRGLTDMGMFNEDLGGGQAVMMFIPVMQSLREATMTVDQLLDTIRTGYARFSVYGFDCNLYDDSIIIGDDYLYLRFYVEQDKTIVGVIDYCLDLVNSRFSYREFIMLTIGGSNEKAMPPSILAIEYDDIPVTIGLDGVGFNTAVFDENGELEKNVIVDMMHINSLEDVELIRYFPTVKSEDGEIALFVRPYDTEYYDINLGDDCRSKLKDEVYAGGTYDPMKFNHKVMQYTVPEYYESGLSIVQHDPRNGRPDYDIYRSYEDYKADSIKQLKNVSVMNFASGTIESDVNETVAVFNYRECSYATSSNGRFGQGNDSFLSAANNDPDDVKSMNFDKFYTQIFVEGQPEDEFWTAFWNAHIRNCGVEDENYIANFIAEWKNVPPGRIWSHTVTNRPSGQ